MVFPAGRGGSGREAAGLARRGRLLPDAIAGAGGRAGEHGGWAGQRKHPCDLFKKWEHGGFLGIFCGVPVIFAGKIGSEAGGGLR